MTTTLQLDQDPSCSVRRLLPGVCCTSRCSTRPPSSQRPVTDGHPGRRRSTACGGSGSPVVLPLKGTTWTHPRDMWVVQSDRPSTTCGKQEASPVVNA